VSLDRATPHPESLLARLLWWPVNLLQALFTAGWTAVCVVVALLALILLRSRRIAMGLARWVWAPGLLWAGGARLRVEGLENVDFSAPHFFVANHQSLLDVCALFAALPTALHFVIKRELARVPFLGWYARAMGMIFVDRSARSEAYASIRRTGGLVREGRSVMAFPEGTRSRDGSVGPFKHGVFVTAIEAGIPVVPVAIEGTGGILPPHGFRARPGRIVVRVGTPIETAGLAVAGRAALADRARQAVIALKAASAASAPVAPPPPSPGNC
jgi:1-acyl-sn-glycerol-3-phosphate acyltransferase